MAVLDGSLHYVHNILSMVPKSGARGILTPLGTGCVEEGLVEVATLYDLKIVDAIGDSCRQNPPQAKCIPKKDIHPLPVSHQKGLVTQNKSNENNEMSLYRIQVACQCLMSHDLRPT